MLNEGGLGNQIDKMVNVNRNNPEGLKKKAKVSGSLIHGLAVQELTEQLNAIKNNQALNAESSPLSVVEEMEENLIQANLQDKTKQIAGVLDQRQNKAKSKQQSMGIATQRPQPRPQGMPQGMPQGAAPTMNAARGGLMGVPRPNLRNMAQGGIIGYVTGGKVKEADIQKWLADNPNVFPKGTDAVRREAALKQLNPIAESQRQGATVTAQERADFKEQNPTTFPNATDDVIDEIIQNEKFGERIVPEPVQSPLSPKEFFKGTATEDVTPEPEELKEPFSAVPKQDGVANRVDPNVAVQPPSLGSDEQLQQILDTPNVNFSSISRTQATDALSPEFKAKVDSRIAVNPENKKQTEVERLSGPAREQIMGEDGKPILGPDGKPTYKELGGMDRQAKAVGLEKYRLAKEKLDEEVLSDESVDKRRTQAYMDGLITGGTGRTGTAARSEFDANIARSRQNSIAEQKAGFLADMKFDVEIADKVNTQANKVFEVYTKDVSEAMDLAARTSATDLEMYYKEAKIAYDTNQDGIKNKIDAFKASTQANLQKLIQSQATMQEISGAANTLLGRINEMQKEFNVSISARKLAINEEISKEETTPERRKVLIEQREEFKNRFEAQKDVMQAHEYMKIYQGMIAEMATNGGLSSQFTTQVQNTLKQTSGNSSVASATGTTKKPSATGIGSLGGQQTGALATLNKYAP